MYRLILSGLKSVRISFREEKLLRSYHTFVGGLKLCVSIGDP